MEVATVEGEESEEVDEEGADVEDTAADVDAVSMSEEEPDTEEGDVEDTAWDEDAAPDEEAKVTVAEEEAVPVGDELEDVVATPE